MRNFKPRTSTYLKRDYDRINQQRIKGFTTIILQRKEISRYEIQKAFCWGAGIYERTANMAKQENADKIFYDKKSHLWTSASKEVIIENQIPNLIQIIQESKNLLCQLIKRCN